MKRHGLTLIEITIVLAVLLILSTILFAVFANRVIPNRQRFNCQRNLRQISLAIKQYARDSGDHFPALHGNRKSYNWADSLKPYIKDTLIFQCPLDSVWPAKGDGPKSRDYTDYFYNSNLSGQNESAIQFTAATVMLGESIPGDARQHSNGGTPTEASPYYRIINRAGAPIGAATRHLNGANYAFADGYVKWLRGSDANTTPAINQRGGHGLTYTIN